MPNEAKALVRTIWLDVVGFGNYNRGHDTI